MNKTVTANSTATGASVEVAAWDRIVEQNEPVPQRGLFEVEVFGFNRIDLVPKNALAEAIAYCLLHGNVSPSMTFRGIANLEKRRTERVTLTISYPPALSLKEGADPFAHLQRLNGEQLGRVEAALAPLPIPPVKTGVSNQRPPRAKHPQSKGKRNA